MSTTDLLDLRGTTPIEENPANPKMPAIHAHWQSGWTVVINLGELAWSLRRAPAEIIEFLGIELDEECKDGKIHGQHTDETLQELVYLFIDKFVLCPNCHQPETEYKCVHKTNTVWHDCSNCGLKKKVIDKRHPLCDYILEQDQLKKEQAKKQKKLAKKKKKEKMTLAEMLEKNNPKQQHNDSDEENIQQDNDNDDDSLATDAAVGNPTPQDLLVRPKNTPSTNIPQNTKPKSKQPPLPLPISPPPKKQNNTAILSTPTTALTMTKQDFQNFQRDNFDQTTEQFMDQIRNAVLTQNTNGEFLQHRISPAVLTDDWVLSATNFAQTIAKLPDTTKTTTKIKASLSSKNKGSYQEGWFKLTLNNKSSFDLGLVMFTKRDDDQLASLLNNIAQKVQTVCENVFPRCTVQVYPVPDLESFLSVDSTNKNAISTNDTTTRKAWEGDSVGQALIKVQELQARGATKSEIKAELKRAQTERKAWTKTNQEDEEKEADQPALAPQKDGDESKYRRKSLWESIVVFRQAPRYWDSPITKGDGVTWWVWKGLFASLALYYVYVWMK